MQIKPCDNTSSCHDLINIGEDNNAMRVICSHCKHKYVIRKDWRGVPENRQYSKIYKKEILQGRDNLFYKYNEQYLAK